MNLNSVELGNALEGKVFDLFKSEIDGNRFVAKSECCRIFRHKGYYSRDRGSDIVFDISIELFLPGSSSYSFLWLIECKNYSSAVPVNDAEEFFAKVQQVSGANAKGVIVSTNAFQEGTVRFSKSKGIGLLRFFGEDDFKWVLHRSASTLRISSSNFIEETEVHRGLTTSSYRSRWFTAYCSYAKLYTTSIGKFLRGLAQSAVSAGHWMTIQPSSPSQDAIVEFIMKDEIEKVSESTLRQIQYFRGPVPLQEICDWQKESAGLSLRYDIPPGRDEQDEAILGRIRFDPLEITVYQQDRRNVGRQRFTLAHELGHLLLGHRKYLRAEYCEAQDFELDDSVGFDDIRRLEWQANYFASCLLLPRRALVTALLTLVRSYDIRERGHGVLFVDDQPCNKNSYYLITNQLKSIFGASRIALKLRLEEVGLLNDVRGTAVRYLPQPNPPKPAEPNQAVQRRAI